MKREITFGFPDFADSVIGAHAPALKLAYQDLRLANELFASVPLEISHHQVVIYMLARMTATGWMELLILARHGAGLGAMKIFRGMFETAVMAEYLRQNPADIEDYLEYGHVTAFKKSQLVRPGRISPEKLNALEAEYRRVKPRFETQNGRVRGQWSRHSISYMAEKIGCFKQYELQYSIAPSIHHGGSEAIIAHISDGKRELDIEQPFLDWVEKSLISGHYCLLQALNTINEFFRLGFDSKLQAAVTAFLNTWEKLSKN